MKIKNRKLRYGFLGFLILGLMLMPIATANSNNNTENFEDDTAGSDPSHGWYTYSDTAWDVVQVVEDNSRTSNHSYNIDDESGANHHAFFNWTSKTTYYLQFYFQIENSSHDRIQICPVTTAGVPCGLYINGGGKIEPFVTFENYTTVDFNLTIANRTWYLVRFDFNYTDNTVWCRVYNNATVLLDGGWLLADPETGNIDISDTVGLVIYGSSGDKSYIWLDDINHNYWVAAQSSMGDQAYILPIAATLISVLLLLYVWRVFTAGQNITELVGIIAVVFIVVASVVALVGI